jgi:transcriptional regulator with XRE-family HTH domain
MKSIFSEDYRKVIETIKDARQNKGLSQKQLATKLGTSQSYVSKLEQRQVRVDIIQLKKIAQQLNLDIKDLLS